MQQVRDDIRRALAQAGFRMVVLEFFRALAWALTGGIVVLILARLGQRMFGMPVAWSVWFMAAGAGALLGAVGWTIITRPRVGRIARTLDDRGDLREALSTALTVSGRKDPWSTLVIETARERARTVKVAQAIPLEAPRLWPVPLGTGLALLIVWISVPNMDLLGLLEERRASESREQEIVQARAQAAEAENRVREAMARAGVNPTDDRGERDPQMPQAGDRTPEDVRREAVRSLTNLADQIRQQQSGERAQQLENLQQQMRQLRQPGPGPLNEFTRELARGNFEQAQQQLEQMMQQMAQGQMSPEQRQQVQQQMQNLSRQLEQNAQNRAQMEQALRNTGISPQQAQQLAQQMAQMSPQQMQQALQQAAQQMQQQGGQPMSQQQMQPMSQMMSQMGQMQSMASEMNATDAAMNEAMAQLAAMGAGSGSGDSDSKDKDMLASMSEEPGEWSQGETQGRQGSGRSGGPGQGNGGRGPQGGTDGQLQAERTQTRNTGQGPVIASSLVQGVGIRGDSVAEFQSVTESASTAAAEALETRSVRREYHRAVQMYFGRLAREAAERAQPAPPAPAQDAPDAGSTPTTPP